MKARFAYPLLYLVPSLMVSVVVMVVAGATTAGVLWLYVHGDDPWPPSAEAVVLAVAATTALVTLAALLYMAYQVGRDREAKGGVTRKHVAIAITLSVVIPVVVLLHQCSIGNIG